MSWALMLVCIFASFAVLLAIGIPVAFCFILINTVAMFFFWGGEAGLRQFILSIYGSVTSFGLLPLPLFILLGEMMFCSGIAPRLLDTLDKWFGRLSGRLAFLTVVAGTIFGTMSGTSMGSVAVIGSTLLPEMEKRGYKKPMTLGPIMGTGGLAVMIPPSALAIIVGIVGEISVGRILLAIIIPGLLLAVFYTIYIVVRCQLQPYLAPAYDVKVPPLAERLADFVRYVLPLSLIVFLVVGIVFLGIATPSEAAATGVIGIVILAFLYRGLNRKTMKESFSGTLDVSVMVLMILVGSKTFSQVLAYSGATPGLVNFAVNLPVSPLSIVVVMQIVVILMGCFMDPVAIAICSLPIFVPIINTLGFDPVWFAVIFCLNIEMATITPPFGLVLFVMKSVASPDTTLVDVYKAVLPFIGLHVSLMALLLAYPTLSLWLPSLIR